MAKHFLLDDGEGRWFDYGSDHGKPTRLLIRPLSETEERSVSQAAFGTRQNEKLAKEPVYRATERMAVFSRRRAMVALLDSENYNLAISGPKSAELFSKFLGREVKAGDEVALDGHWTPEVREFVFRNLRDLARDVSNFATEVFKAEAQDEEGATEDFSQP